MALTRRISSSLVGIFFLSLGLQSSLAHTLPISYLTVVPDQDYVHLELTLNPFELNFFAEIDLNHDQKLSAAELQRAEQRITESLLTNIQVKVAGASVAAETSGILCDPESDHLTLRAHYHAAAMGRTIGIDSSLSSITSASHLTQAVYGSGEHQQWAQLNSESTATTFGPPEPSPRSPSPGPGETSGRAYVPMLFLAALPTIGIFIALLSFIRKLTREASTG